MFKMSENLEAHVGVPFDNGSYLFLAQTYRKTANTVKGTKPGELTR